MIKKPLVSVVVLNWNGLEDLKTCLASLGKLDYPSYETIVVDNGSSDGSKEYLTKLDGIIYIDLPENTGFTGGHKAGYDKSRGDYVALLNNDCVVAKNWLSELVKTLGEHKDAAAVGGRSFIWNDKFPTYNTDNFFYSYQEVDSNKAYTRTMMTGEEECLVDSISGAALLVDKSKVEEVGYLDDDFFAYYEETDLLARLKRRGYNAYYSPNAQVWHRVAASSEGGDSGKFYLFQMHRNRYYFAYKNFDRQNLKRFINSYSREVMIARVKQLMGRGNVETSCRIEAYHDVKRQSQKLEEKRRQVLKLGKTYNDTLHQHHPDDVTIIIPCYNYADHVSEAINSALKQTHTPKKILVINDGSTDDSLKVINQFKDNPLIEIVDKKNEGVIATKNLGIKLSKTYWTMFLDADDIIDEDMLRTTLKSIKNDGMVDVVYTDMRLFGVISDIFKAKPFQAHSFLAQNYINNTTLINTTHLKRSGGYKEEMSRGLEDWELYITLFDQGASFRYIPQALVWYRQHTEDQKSRNTEVRDIDKGRVLYGQIKSLHPHLYKKYGGRQRFSRIIFKMFYVPVRHPGVFIVIFRSIPGSIKQAMRHMLHNVRIYLQSM